MFNKYKWLEEQTESLTEYLQNDPEATYDDLHEKLLQDMETCYKLFKTNLVQGFQLQEKRFGFEPEVTARISRVPNIRIYEVGISYYGRTYAEGKKINWKDGFRAIYCIVKYNLFSK